MKKQILTESEQLRDLIESVKLKNIVEFEEIEDDSWRLERRKKLREEAKKRKEIVAERSPKGKEQVTEVAEFEEIEDDPRSRRQQHESSHGINDKWANREGNLHANHAHRGEDPDSVGLNDRAKAALNQMRKNAGLPESSITTEVAEFEELDDQPMRRNSNQGMDESVDVLDENFDINSMSYEEQLKLLQQHPQLIGRVSNPSEEMQQLAVSVDPQAIRHIPNPTEVVQVKALSKQPELIHTMKAPSDWARQVARHHSAGSGSMREQMDIVEWGNSPFNKYEDRGIVFPEPIEGETVDNSLRKYLDAKPMKVTTDITESQMVREYDKFKTMK